MTSVDSPVPDTTRDRRDRATSMQIDGRLPKRRVGRADRLRDVQSHKKYTYDPLVQPSAASAR